MVVLSRRLEPGFVVDVLLGVAAAGVGTWWWHQFRLGGLIFGSLVGLVLMWRRRRPLVVLTAVLVLTGLAAPIEVGDSRLHEGMLLLSIAVATYALVAHSTSVTAAVAGGAAALAWAAFLLAARPWPGQPWAFPEPLEFLRTTWQVSGMAALVWAAALTARFVRQQRAATAERLAVAEREQEQLTRLAVAEERSAIARELHDIVAHSLSVMILQANGGEYALDHDAERTRQALRTISATGADALEEIRQLVQMLRGAGDAGIGDTAPLGGVAAAVERARAAGLPVDLRQDGDAPSMPDGVELAVYRIVQESLTNTRKHGGPASAATVRVRYESRSVDVEVVDSGAGGPAAGGGHGLVGMRERALLYGGTFDAGPVLGGGWRVRAHIPLAAETKRATGVVTA